MASDRELLERIVAFIDRWEPVLNRLTQVPWVRRLLNLKETV